MKKIILGILVLSMFFMTMTSTENVNASQKEMVSSDELLNALQKLYSNYSGISVNMIDSNGVKSIPKTEYNRIMNEAKVDLDRRENLIVKNENISGALMPDNNIGLMAIMPYTYVKQVDNITLFGRNPVTMRCPFSVSINATADAQYNKFIAINSSAVFRSGSSVNVKSCDISNKVASLSSDRALAYVTANVSIVFEYTVSGMTYQDTVNSVVGNTFKL